MDKITPLQTVRFASFIEDRTQLEVLPKGTNIDDIQFAFIKQIRDT